LWDSDSNDERDEYQPHVTGNKIIRHKIIYLIYSSFKFKFTLVFIFLLTRVSDKFAHFSVAIQYASSFRHFSRSVNFTGILLLSLVRYIIIIVIIIIIIVIKRNIL